MNVTNDFNNFLNDWYNPIVYLGIPIALVVGTYVMRRYFNEPPVPAPQNRSPDRVFTPITLPLEQKKKLDKFKEELLKIEISPPQNGSRNRAILTERSELFVSTLPKPEAALLYKGKVTSIIEEIEGTEFEIPELSFKDIKHFCNIFRRIQKSNLERVSAKFLELNEELLKMHSENRFEIESQLREAEKFYNKYSSEIIENSDSILKSLKKYPFFYETFNGEDSDFSKVEFPKKLVNLLDPYLTNEIQINNLDELNEILNLYNEYWDVLFSLRQSLNDTLKILSDNIIAIPK